MSRTVLEKPSRLSDPKRRLDITVSRECKDLVDRVIHAELQDDATDNRPARTKSAILEMLIRKGVKIWEVERRVSSSQPNQ